ncbi:hypothetical protein D3C76_1631680 [compost metagenome]
MNDQAVGKGDRRIGDAFAAAEDLRQPVEVLVDAVKQHVRQLCRLSFFAQPLAHHQQQPVAGGHAVFYRSQIDVGQQPLQVGAAIGAAQLVFQAVAERDQQGGKLARRLILLR